VVPDWQRVAEVRGRELAGLRLAADRAPKTKKGVKTLRPVRANLGLAADYRRRLERLVVEMEASVLYWVRAQYRADPPATALDEAPAASLRRSVQGLRRQWFRRFNDASAKLARWFARSARARSDRVLAKILRDGGWAVEFKTTPGVRDVIHSAVAENVALIRSIPQRYLLEVEGAVARSVQAGRDLHQLTEDLMKIRGVTRRRAELISRDQNNKVTAAITRARYSDLGITDAIWVHSHAGKQPRPTHLKNDGKKYRVKDGWYDPDPRVKRHIQPGELINCRCFSRPVVPGFS
jgi:SPP1 gp7 family putative phage head morphogenesis protein